MLVARKLLDCAVQTFSYTMLGFYRLITLGLHSRNAVILDNFGVPLHV